jgi:hypothetical protein
MPERWYELTWQTGAASICPDTAVVGQAIHTIVLQYVSQVCRPSAIVIWSKVALGARSRATVYYRLQANSRPVN